MKTIIELRKEIDQIDEEVVKLLIKRMDVSKAIGKSKEKITDKSREMTVIINALNTSEEKLDPTFLRELYELIIAESKRIQFR
ncbi:MAG: chorismate mutase [Candidatus Aminicenantes bacterium]|nr:chorismate mutase [Candidatus Aminicenantes bacterium]